jgi:hypothetical protein
MKLKDVMLCDDIRTEVANKFSLMGIYYDVIRILSRPELPVAFPINMRLGLMVRLAADETDQFPLTFKIRYHINNEGEIPNQREKIKLVNLPLITNVPITKQGTLSFDLQLFKNEVTTQTFNNLYSVEVVVDPPQMSFVEAPSTV